MNETEWLHSEDVLSMMQYIYRRMKEDFREGNKATFPTRLWGSLTAEVLRLVQDLVYDPRLQRAITTVGASLEGAAGSEEVRTALDEVHQLRSEIRKKHPFFGFANPAKLDDEAARALIYVLGFSSQISPGHYAHLSLAIVQHFSGKHLDETKCCRFIRCAFGNPFRPAAFDASWLTSQVVAIAERIHQGRRFEEMPDLARALAEAGCADEEVLQHCRVPGDHVRDCLVVRGSSGKE